MQTVRGRRSSTNFVGLIVVLCTLLSIAAGSAAYAAAPQKLWKAGFEPGASDLSLPHGIAADPNLPGHVYVADSDNRRIAEFNAWGEFVKAWGWGVRTGANDLQTCTEETGCVRGVAGSGAGQMSGPGGLAVDSVGNVYVFDTNNYRVQKFNSSGEFLLMFGGEVNKTTNADVCTKTQLEGGNVCGAGVAGVGQGEFGPADEVLWSLYYGSRLAIAPGDAVAVGDDNRIQEFTSSGVFKGERSLPGVRVNSLSVDQAGNFYYTNGKNSFGSSPDVFKISPTGAPLCTLKVPNPTAVAVDSSNRAYAVSRTGEALPSSELIQANSSCGEPATFGQGDGLTSAEGIASGAACISSDSDIYVTNTEENNSFIRAYGPPPDDPSCPPPPKPPTIGPQFATAVDAGSATVKAEVNPRFWKDTSYYVEYGTGACSAGGCTQLANFPGVALGAGVVDAEVVTAGVPLVGLAADTEYHYRFVATSTGGGPVKGQGGTVGSDGSEATFTTPPLPSSTADTCGNAIFRAGPAARLADCRAFEMVSPVDKAGSDILALDNVTSLTARMDQSSTTGSKLTYSTYRAFGDAEAAPYISQYMASRGPNGWASTAIAPVREGPSLTGSHALDTEFKAFTPDLGRAVLLHEAEPVLATGGVPGFSNLYDRDNTSKTLTALSTSPVLNVKPNEFRLDVQGQSLDGSHVIFRSNDHAPPAVKEAGSYQLYESVGGAINPVCVLPNETISTTACTAGTLNLGLEGRSATLDHAISDDGSRIFWTNAEGGTLGKIYVRINGAVTLGVSDAVNPGSPPAQARFWTAAADGSKAIFTVAQNLYEFDVDTDTATLIAGGVAGVAGASDDVSRIYLVSQNVLGSDPGPSAGKPNLYLYEAGGSPSFDYIATLAAGDATVSATYPSLIEAEPRFHVARTTADGMHMAFMARSSLTGSDNLDAVSGEADSEVFLYDAGLGQLTCVSCNRTGARPKGMNIQEEERLIIPYWASGQIPAAETQTRFSQILSEDGSRLFFESLQPLAQGDTNGKRDVYEWERLGAGTCTTSETTYSSIWAGCVNLISSGESPADSRLVDAGANGDDVFFTTTSSLVTQDPGLIDIYDARAGGGYPPPPPSPAQCEGEACQAAPVLPNDTTPSSSTFVGPGNPATPRPAKKCPKGKKKAKRGGKTVCVKKSKKSKTKKSKAKAKGGASR